MKKYNKLSNILKKYIFLVFLILTLCGCSSNQSVLKSIAKPSMNINGIMTPEWYFFSNDKMYAYYGNGSDTGFYSFDLNGRNRKLLVDDRANVQEVKIRYPYFYLVKNSEAYFYTNYDNSLKKVNLNTGEVTTLIKNKFLNLIPDTLKNEKILVTYTNYYEEESYTYFAKLDLKNYKLTDEKYVNYPIDSIPYFSKDENAVYYIENGDVYKDNSIIYSKNENLKYRFVFTQDDYIFITTSNKIIKLNKDNHSLIEENNILNEYNVIPSGCKDINLTLGSKETITTLSALENPIFENDKDIYVFNSKTMNFEKIIDNSVYNRYVQKYGNYLIIENDTQIIIYNIDTQKYKKYSAVNYTVEGKYIYLMTYENDFYTSDAQFKVKKVLLDEI